MIGFLRRRSRHLIVAGFAALVGLGGVVPAAGAAPVAGYRLLGGDGGIFAFGTRFAGSAASNPNNCPPNLRDRMLPNGTCFAFAATPDGKGYWILNSDNGKVFAFGTATLFGAPAATGAYAGVPRDLTPSGVAIVSTPDAKGYWVLLRGLSDTGTVQTFGDAAKFGDTTTLVRTRFPGGFNGSPVALAATPDGKGYWEVHSDGGVFAFGDAHFFGSAAGRHLAAPVVAIAPTADGKGYWLATADGNVFGFGDAAVAGSMAGRPLNQPIVGIARNVGGTGYWLAARDGGVFAFGGAPFLGSMVGKFLARPIFAIASSIRA